MTLRERSDGESESGGDTTDSDLEGPDFECPEGVSVESACPAPDVDLAGRSVYHRWDVGWSVCVLKRKVQVSSVVSRNGKLVGVKIRGSEN